MTARDLAEKLADKLLVREVRVFDALEVLAASRWLLVEPKIRRVWRKGLVRNRTQVTRLLTNAANRYALAAHAVGVKFLQECADETWSTIVAEMKSIEKDLGPKYVGIAGKGLNQVDRQLRDVTAVAQLTEAFDVQVEQFVGRVTDLLVVTRKLDVDAVIQAAHLEWAIMMRAFKMELRNIQFIMINNLRADAILAVNKAAE